MVSETVDRWRERDGRAAAEPLRRRLDAWRTAALPNLRNARPALPPELGDRAQDVCEPLLAIADLAGREWPVSARRAVVALGATTPDSDPAVELLTDIRAIIAGRGASAIASTALIAELTKLEDRPWATWREGERPITGRGLARLLEPLQIYPGKHGGIRGYRVDAFVDAFARYLPPQTSKCPDANNDRAKTAGETPYEGYAPDLPRTGFRPNSEAFETFGHLDSEDNCDDDVRY